MREYDFLLADHAASFIWRGLLCCALSLRVRRAGAGILTPSLAQHFTQVRALGRRKEIKIGPGCAPALQGAATDQLASACTQVSRQGKARQGIQRGKARQGKPEAERRREARKKRAGKNASSHVKIRGASGRGAQLVTTAPASLPATQAILPPAPPSGAALVLLCFRQRRQLLCSMQL